MTDAQTHLKSAIEQRDNIINEISELNKQINSKRELKSKSYKYIGVDGKEVIGIGKFFDKET